MCEHSFYALINFECCSWNILDFMVVLISVLDLLLLNDSFGSLKALRIVRVLRPLRLIRRAHGMRLTIESILMSLKPCIATSIITLVLLCVFAIVSVSLYAGGFGHCRAADGTAITKFQTINSVRPVTNWLECTGGASGEWADQVPNFNNFTNAVRLLSQVALVSGAWYACIHVRMDAIYRCIQCKTSL